MNEQAETRKSSRLATRLFVGAAMCMAGMVAVAPAAGALASGDQYSDIDPGTSYPMPDLVVSIRTVGVLDGAGSWVGDKPVVTVKNIGNKRAPASSVTLQSKEQDQLGYTKYRGSTSSVPALDPGQSFSTDPYYFRKPCYVWMTATADSAKVVSEGNENNNITSREITHCA